MKGIWLLLFSMFTVCISCKYSKPMFTVHDGKETIIDSITHSKNIVKDFNYFCLRRGPGLGDGRISRIYNSKGVLISKTITKSYGSLLFPGRNGHMIYHKTIQYDSLGHRTKVDKRMNLEKT